MALRDALGDPRVGTKNHRSRVLKGMLLAPSIRWTIAFALKMALTVALTVGCASSGGHKKPEVRKRTVLLTSSDDVRAGVEAAKAVKVDIGLLDDPALLDYIDSIGKKLLRGLPQREFSYEFLIVDQMEPNAFALPGGHIYVSRGLLALVNNEDELACVMGHEIVHVAKRHAAQQQAVARYESPLAFPLSRAATLAAYGRDMEREADAIGQQLCAAAGYDPMGMSTFMRSLERRERLLVGHARRPMFLDTHPGTDQRAAIDSARASELRWTRDPNLGDVRADHLDRIDGMIIGDRPETGVFEDELFMQPALGFQMRFPNGWEPRNSNTAVGATAPRGEAAVYLTGDLPEGDLATLADEWSAKAVKEEGVVLTEKKHVQVGNIKAVRYGFQGGSGVFGISAKVTFFPFAGATWRMVGIAPLSAENRYFGPILLSMRSFGPLTDQNRALIHTNRLRVVLTRPGEDMVAFKQRSVTTLTPLEVALFNGFLGNEIFQGGELMKIVRRED